MDIVGRIKKFLNEKNITVSQFADGCGISRPTMSQLLNGRNKKVSDEIISKIHFAFPTLSIVWLMFGEGEMFSEKSDDIAQPRENLIFADDSNDDSKHRNVVENLFSEQNQVKPMYKPDSIVQTAVMQKSMKVESIEVEKPIRNVTKIIVYYSDNSFEEFVPR